MKWVNKPNVMSAGASPIGCFVDPCDFCGLYLCWQHILVVHRILSVKWNWKCQNLKQVNF